MALTRRLLKGLGLDEEQIETVLGEHEQTAEALKRAEADAQRLADAEKELAEAKEALNAKSEELAKEREAFALYRAQAAEKAANEEKAALFRKALIEAGVSERHIDAIVRASDLTPFAVTDGKFEDEKAVAAYIRSEWGDFIPEVKTRGVRVENPPEFGEAGMSRPQIMGIRDDTERQRAIARNIDRFRV